MVRTKSRDGELDSAYAGLIHPGIFLNKRATAVALGRKPMISARPFPLTRTARLITGHPLPPNPLTDTREVSSSPITLVDLNFPLVLESLPL